MTMRSKISNELQVVRYKSGIKLMRPNVNNKLALSDLLNQSFNVFIQDLSYNILEANESCWANCGFDSRRKVIGKNLIELYDNKAMMDSVLKNNEVIIKQEKNIFANEHMQLDDGTEINTLSLKFPWYDENNVLIGLIGCALPVNNANVNGVAKSLNYLNAYLLDSYATNFSITVNPPYALTPRERDVVKYIIRGKTLRETARLLNLSKRTIESYFENVKNKIGVYSKSEVIDKLYEHFREE